ncbi:MAG: hypothetical protein RMJ81_00440 [Candidatus Kryptonium sp.]|nr:hypothetical protein [Candidatus Kryptonium sp.]MCX7763242.1 hypothetical protein [Candidatus Kryptonium sp.]MDW8108105.1 hypothetical protein [Candidatus Kryptonium sp.]
MATVEDNVYGLEKHLMNFGEEIVVGMRNDKKEWNYYGKNGGH